MGVPVHPSPPTITPVLAILCVQTGNCTQEWSTHESFPRRHDDDYYEAAYQRLRDLAFWLFTGSPGHEGAEAYAPM